MAQPQCEPVAGHPREQRHDLARTRTAHSATARADAWAVAGDRSSGSARLPGRLPDRRRLSLSLPGEVPPLPTGGVRRAVSQIKRVLIGRPIATADEPHERVNVFTGLAVFASDNISSSAYATEEIMRVLILAGAARSR